jgi:hypothetical protein
MHELMLLMAKAMPIDMLIEHMEKAIIDYKTDPTKENRQKLGTLCLLFTSKEVIDNTGGDVLKTIKDVTEHRKVMDMVSMKNNLS